MYFCEGFLNRPKILHISTPEIVVEKWERQRKNFVVKICKGFI